jgi:hypothetical protein
MGIEMKKTIMAIYITVAVVMACPTLTRAQSIADVIQELILDYQKLAGMKSTLNQMYNGYGMLANGYNAVKGVSMDNFNLHKIFLDAQLLVSSSVRSYPRGGDIIKNQNTLLKEYHIAIGRFKNNQLLNAAEKSSLNRVYDRLTQASETNLEELERILSDNELRMTDSERLKAIDRLYIESQDQLSYIRKFNMQIGKIIELRQVSFNERRSVISLYR